MEEKISEEDKVFFNLPCMLMSRKTAVAGIHERTAGPGVVQGGASEARGRQGQGGVGEGGGGPQVL